MKRTKAIAAGARAEYEDDKKRRDQLRARARLLRKRVHSTSRSMEEATFRPLFFLPLLRLTPYTLNPSPSSINPKPQILNPRPKT